jgi:hypothetical protein
VVNLAAWLLLAAPGALLIGGAAWHDLREWRRKRKIDAR